MKKVLIACEFSGVVREAFRKRGHDAWSLDLLPSEDNSPYHMQMDINNLANLWRWDLVIGHPPCTRLANSGVRWLKERNLWDELFRACRFFNKILLCGAKQVCVENPIPHKYARKWIGGYTQIIQPWQFGHGETKATCLWLRGLPELKPTNIVEGREARIHKMPPSKDRWKQRSITYQGIADAMATQWG